ncbi:hypothetical protein HNR47_003159 [Methylopila jiangsuensis]|nr:hypothetical protein [Methylopila jiangsuensis]
MRTELVCLFAALFLLAFASQQLMAAKAALGVG